MSSSLKTIVYYNLLLIRRNIAFRCYLFVFFLLLVLGWGIWSYRDIWVWKALSSSLPGMTAFALNMIQPWIILFCLKPLRLDTMEAYLVRPVGNAKLIFGRIGSLLLLLCFVDVVVFLFSFLIQFLFSYTALNITLPFFYILFLILPSLVFICGFVYLFMNLLRNRSLALGMILGGLFVVNWYLADVSYGIFDFLGRFQVNLFSDVLGFDGSKWYFVHRGAYFVLGVGMIGGAIALCPRLTNFRNGNYWWGVAGITLMITGGGMLYCYREHFQENERIRNEYILTELKYRNYHGLHAITHQLKCTFLEDRLTSVSKLEVENGSDSQMDKVVLYLNPALEVTSVVDSGRELAYYQENQVLVIGKSLESREKFHLEITYSGSIDDRICSLVESAEEYQDTKLFSNYHTILSGGVLRIAKHYAYLQDDLILLPKECLWYPVCPTGRFETDFTFFSLQAGPLKGKTVVSQGQMLIQDDSVLYTNAQPLPGISFCMGAYEKKSIQLDSLKAEIYYFKKHSALVDGYRYVSEEDIRKCLVTEKAEWETMHYYRKFPMKKMSLVETPVAFSVANAAEGEGSSWIQPEMIFLPEAGVTMLNFTDIRRVLDQQRKSSRSKVDQKIVKEEIYNFFGRLFYSPVYSLKPSFGEYVRCFESNNYPPINQVIEWMFLLDFGPDGFNRSEYQQSDLQIKAYLSGKSFKMAFEDPALNREMLERMMYLKSVDLKARIALLIPWEKFYVFLQDYIQQHAYGRISFEKFCDDVQTGFEVDLRTIMKEWYTEKQLPVLWIREMKVQQLKDQKEQYILNVEVENVGKCPGILSVGRAGNGVAGRNFSSYQILPGENKVIRHSYDYLPGRLWASTNLSTNIPMDYILENSEKEKFEETEDSRVGIFDVSTKESLDEIIVDDDDEGFTVVKQQSRLRHVFRKEEESPGYATVNSYPKWTKAILHGSYGKGIRSVYCKGNGEGNAKVMWKTKLKKEGEYEVFVYIPEFLSSVSTFGYQASRLSYEVGSGNEMENVLLEVNHGTKGWCSLGNFYFPAGDVKVLLNDKTLALTTNETVREIIYADAVKWVYLR